MTREETRFWAYVEIRGKDDCWEWQKFINKGGYGQFRVGSVKDGTRRNDMTHRISYRLSRGDIPPGLLVCHTCDNPKCVNPNHLFLGTYADNRKDCISKGRHHFGESHGNSVLSESDIIKIRSDHRSQRAIARDFGINQTTVHSIKNFLTWRHVA
jgi:hypothetical protein